MGDSRQEGITDRAPARKLALSIAFWLVTYSIMTLRARLDPNGAAEWLTLKRFLTISLGTALYLLAIRHLDRLAGRPLSARLLAGCLWTAAGGAALLAARWGLGELSTEPFDAPEDTRWLLAWLGYFLAWIGIYLAIDVPGAGAQETADHLDPMNEVGKSEGAVWIQANRQSVRVPIESVEWFEAQGNYIRVHALGADGLVRGSLSKLEERLDPRTFVRVHRAVICRRSSIRSLRRTSTGAMRAFLASGVEVPVGRSMGKSVVDAVRSEKVQVWPAGRS